MNPFRNAFHFWKSVSKQLKFHTLKTDFGRNKTFFRRGIYACFDRRTPYVCFSISKNSPKFLSKNLSAPERNGQNLRLSITLISF
ncbi:hypothetical protein LEP1GSC162_1963 [Leptospira santarosai str. CBC1531]|nr:hypothetical protein LEP1GSC162_1963 [Leptospira santarosai str. CBC1531]